MGSTAGEEQAIDRGQRGGENMSDLFVLGGKGSRILDTHFRFPGSLALRALGRLPPGLRERLLFGCSFWCLFLQKAVQRLLGGPALVHVQFNSGPLEGHFFECLTSEKYFLLGHAYEAAVGKWLRETVKPGDVAYDVGAHAGYWSLYLSVLCGLRGCVFAFEPSPINFQRLQRNLQLNQKTNIMGVNFGVSDEEAEAFILEKGSFSSIVPAQNASRENCAQARMVRLDDFVYRDGRPAPAFLKIDVEGHAGRCLAGMRNVLEQAKPRILCEVHDEQEEGQVSEILEGHSYHIGSLEVANRFPRHIVGSP